MAMLAYIWNCTTETKCDLSWMHWVYSLRLEFVAPNLVNVGNFWNSQHTSLWTYKSSLLAKAQLPSFCKEVTLYHNISENNFRVFYRFCQVPLTSMSPISVTLTWQEDCSACICCISKLHEAPEISWQTSLFALPETPLQITFFGRYPFPFAIGPSPMLMARKC